MPLMYWRPCMELTVEAEKGEAWRTLVVQVGPPISAGYREARASNGGMASSCPVAFTMQPCAASHMSPNESGACRSPQLRPATHAPFAPPSPSPHPQESTTLFNLHRIIQTSLCKSKMPSDSRLEQQVGFYKAKLVRKSAGQLRPGVLVLHLSPASPGPSLLLSLLELPGPICKQAFAFYLRGDKLKAPKTSELASTAGSAFMNFFNKKMKKTKLHEGPGPAQVRAGT